jgi:hypothetical protein
MLIGIPLVALCPNQGYRVVPMIFPYSTPEIVWRYAQIHDSGCICQAVGKNTTIC